MYLPYLILGKSKVRIPVMLHVRPLLFTHLERSVRCFRGNSRYQPIQPVMFFLDEDDAAATATH